MIVIIVTNPFSFLALFKPAIDIAAIFKCKVICTVNLAEARLSSDISEPAVLAPYKTIVGGEPL